MRICDVPRKEHPLRQVGRSPRDRRHGMGRACRAPRGRRSRRFTRWSDPPREGPRLSRPNWERRRLGGATGPPGILPVIGVAGVSPATGTTGVPPVGSGQNRQCFPRLRAERECLVTILQFKLAASRSRYPPSVGRCDFLHLMVNLVCFACHDTSSF